MSTEPAVHSLARLAELVQGEVVGDAGLNIAGVAPLDSATAGQISHLSAAAFLGSLPVTTAGAVLLRAEHLADCPTNAIVVSNPYWAYARISQLFESTQQPEPGISELAVIADSAVLGDAVRIAAGAHVGIGARLGARVCLHPNAVIGPGCTLGEGVIVHAGAVLHAGVTLGDACVVHPNAVIGAEGFGYAPDDRGHLERIAQLGSVVLGANVSVGAGSTIDRGALGDTRIGDGVKIDNQVQIGHNCVIGSHTVICGCCGIVGSTTIGAHCVLGGGVGVGGDGPITLCDGVTVSGMTHVSRSIDKPGVYSGGVLHAETRTWKRNALRFTRLDELAKRVRKLEQRLGRK